MTRYQHLQEQAVRCVEAAYRVERNNGAKGWEMFAVWQKHAAALRYQARALRICDGEASK